MGVKMDQIINVAVLFGGCSPEYCVSLQSAYAVITHMDRRKYRPVLIGISQAGEWFHFTGSAEQIAADTWLTPQDCAPAFVPPGRREQALLVLEGGAVKKIRLDAAFPVLHGRNGEDGTVQGVFETAGIPLVGCGVLSSALCMDKDRAHKLAHTIGAAVPASFAAERGVDAGAVLAQAERLGYPLFVKPVRAGSSYGITRVMTCGELPAAVKLAFSYDGRILLEKEISGFEVGCAVLGNDHLTVGELDEVEVSGGFFDFTEKYTLRTSALHVPARISPEKSLEIKELAKRIYRVLDCRGFARVDFFLDESGQVLFNEVNTIPGFTAHSRYPNMMKAAGLSLEQVVSAVIGLAVGE